VERERGTDRTSRDRPDRQHRRQERRRRGTTALPQIPHGSSLRPRPQARPEVIRLPVWRRRRRLAPALAAAIIIAAAIVIPRTGTSETPAQTPRWPGETIGSNSPQGFSPHEFTSRHMTWMFSRLRRSIQDLTCLRQITACQRAPQKYYGLPRLRPVTRMSARCQSARPVRCFLQLNRPGMGCRENREELRLCSASLARRRAGLSGKTRSRRSAGQLRWRRVRGFFDTK